MFVRDYAVGATFMVALGYTFVNLKKSVILYLRYIAFGYSRCYFHSDITKS